MCAAQKMLRLCLRWVKTGKAQTEHMFSGSPPLADINESRQHFRIVQERL
jgi:hypothetical protein